MALSSTGWNTGSRTSACRRRTHRDRDRVGPACRTSSEQTRRDWRRTRARSTRAFGASVAVGARVAGGERRPDRAPASTAAAPAGMAAAHCASASPIVVRASPVVRPTNGAPQARRARARERDHRVAAPGVGRGRARPRDRGATRAPGRARTRRTRRACPTALLARGSFGGATVVERAVVDQGRRREEGGVAVGGCSEQRVDARVLSLGDHRVEHRRTEVVRGLEQHRQRFGHALGVDLGCCACRACLSPFLRRTPAWSACDSVFAYVVLDAHRVALDERVQHGVDACAFAAACSSFWRSKCWSCSACVSSCATVTRVADVVEVRALHRDLLRLRARSTRARPRSASALVASTMSTSAPMSPTARSWLCDRAMSALSCSLSLPLSTATFFSNAASSRNSTGDRVLEVELAQLRRPRRRWAAMPRVPLPSAASPTRGVAGDLAVAVALAALRAASDRSTTTARRRRRGRRQRATSRRVRGTSRRRR